MTGWTDAARKASAAARAARAKGKTQHTANVQQAAAAVRQSGYLSEVKREHAEKAAARTYPAGVNPNMGYDEYMKATEKARVARMTPAQRKLHKQLKRTRGK
jgi:hypothetical protein